MSAREVSENVRLTPRAKRKLSKLRRELAARVDANVAFSGAIEYAVDVTVATHEWLAEMQSHEQPLDYLGLEVERFDAGLTEGGKS